MWIGGNETSFVDCRPKRVTTRDWTQPPQMGFWRNFRAGLSWALPILASTALWIKPEGLLYYEVRSSESHTYDARRCESACGPDETSCEGI